MNGTVIRYTASYDSSSLVFTPFGLEKRRLKFEPIVLFERRDNKVVNLPSYLEN